MSHDITRGLPVDLVSVLQDESVVISKDAAVFEILASWADAPAVAASAVLSPGDGDLRDAVYHARDIASSTTPAGCC